MERVLNQDERIRRAEELYERRKMQVNNRVNATVNVDKVSNNKYKIKLVFQIIICILIYCAFYAIKNIPNMVSQEVMYKISDILEYDINIQELYNKFNAYINKSDEESNTSVENNTLIEETLSVTDNVSEVENVNVVENSETTISNQEEIQEENVEPQVVEESSSLSQMQIDAEYIKANYSIIKPLEGEITSRYGIRNPTVPTVPKYHTGIDIARDEGVEIISATNGKVALASSEGAYGNHLKIVIDDVTIIYAHCSSLLVKQDDEILQGQTIAKVGSTGNSTGPHLHLEIRLNGRPVNPQNYLYN